MRHFEPCLLEVKLNDASYFHPIKRYPVFTIIDELERYLSAVARYFLQIAAALLLNITLLHPFERIKYRG